MSKITRVVFLDIDGVLNAMEPDDRGRIGTFFRRECIDALNLILATEARIVLSSTWRYMLPDTGCWEVLLHSHGAMPINGRVIGRTCADEDVRGRGLQIDRWIRSTPGDFRCVAIDDEDDQITSSDLLLVRTNASVGMTEADARRAIELLKD